jgi:hypothetical protein
MKFQSIGLASKEVGVSYLGSINSSAKIIKNQKVSNNYTYILYLAPASTSGYNVCKCSTPECRLGCLNSSGRNILSIKSDNKINIARIKKTKLLIEHPEFFIDWCAKEIKKYQLKAKKDGYYFSIRLNGTSDIDWATVKSNGKNLFELFPEVQFYDYTKDFSKVFNTPSNYDITFSYTGRNWENCETVLKQGKNVAVIFNVDNTDQFPATFKGYEVINGDLTDYRPGDKKGCIVGLKFKKIADKENNKTIKKSIFVVQI